jgi:hypothetical protein
VWSFALPGGDSYILALGFPGKPSIRTASHFPCSTGLDFSFVCKEFNLRVNGSFHGCIDYPFVARWIFVPFSSYFRQFSCAACSFDFEVFGFEFVWWVSWIVVSCIFVIDLDPPNFEFDLRLKDFGWTLGFCFSSVSIQLLEI